MLLTNGMGGVRRCCGGTTVCILASEARKLPVILLRTGSCKLPLIDFSVVAKPSSIVHSNRGNCLIGSCSVSRVASGVLCLVRGGSVHRDFSSGSRLSVRGFDRGAIIGG